MTEMETQRGSKDRASVTVEPSGNTRSASAHQLGMGVFSGLKHLETTE